jgi:hypothetical protein
MSPADGDVVAMRIKVWVPHLTIRPVRPIANVFDLSVHNQEIGLSQIEQPILWHSDLSY